MILYNFFSYCRIQIQRSKHTARTAKISDSQVKNKNEIGNIIRPSILKSGKSEFGVLKLPQSICVRLIIIKTSLDHLHWINLNFNPVDWNQIFILTEHVRIRILFFKWFLQFFKLQFIIIFTFLNISFQIKKNIYWCKYEKKINHQNYYLSIPRYVRMPIFVNYNLNC